MEDPVNLGMPRGYTYKILRFEKREGSNFTCTVRIKEVKNEDTATTWLKAYEKISKVSWRVKRTYKLPGVVKIFHKDFRCHHNTDKRYRRTLKRTTKHTGCPAFLKIKIKRHSDFDKHISDEDREFPCICELYSWHNHSLDSVDVLKFRKMSNATKEKLFRFYKQGHSATSTRQAMQTELMLQNAKNYETLAADTSYLPSISTIQHMFNSFPKLCKVKQGKKVHADLSDAVKRYCRTSCGKAALLKIDSNVAVAICTPIMQRTIKYLPKVSELIFVDASSHMERLNHTVYFFVSAGIACGAPVGCILTDSEDEDVFREGLLLLKKCFPKKSVLARRGPKAFLTGVDPKERQTLSTVWQKSVFALCRLSVLRAAWKWLCRTKNGVPKDKQQELYFCIKDFIYARTERKLYTKYEYLQNMESVQDNKKLSEYLSFLWDSNDLWADCYSTGIPVLEKQYANSTFRILKDVILDSVKTYNLVQLFDFIVTKLETYLHHRYMDLSLGQFPKPLLKNFLLRESKVEEQDIIYDSDKKCHIVSNENGSCFVDINTCFCSCRKGSNGHICMHISAVAQLTDCDVGSNHSYSQTTRVIMSKIATGEVTPRIVNVYSTNEQFPSLNENGRDARDDLNNDESRVFGQVQRAECEDFTKELEKFFDRIRGGLRNNAAVFHPAVKKFIQNANNFAPTEAALTNALCNFGQNSAPSTLYLLQTAPVPVNSIIITTTVPSCTG